MCLIFCGDRNLLVEGELFLSEKGSIQSGRGTYSRVWEGVFEWEKGQGPN